MTVNDLPQELLSRIREQFYATPKVKQMEVTRQMFLRNGNFKAALAMAAQMAMLAKAAKENNGSSAPKFFKYCGSSADSKFCPNCGAKLV